MDNATPITPERVTLKIVADYLGLTPGTISAVLNNTVGAVRIPQATERSHKGRCPRVEISTERAGPRLADWAHAKRKG